MGEHALLWRCSDWQALCAAWKRCAQHPLPIFKMPRAQRSVCHACVQVAAVRELLGAAARKGAKKGSKGPKRAAAPKSPHEAFKVGGRRW